MPKISEVTTLRRAKALCKKDGKNWDFAFNPPLPPGSKIGVKFFIDDEGRREYLARARQQLLSEAMMIRCGASTATAPSGRMPARRVDSRWS